MSTYIHIYPCVCMYMILAELAKLLQLEVADYEMKFALLDDVTGACDGTSA